MHNSIDVMLDLETTGIAAGCGILSIGACTFSLENTFYQKIQYQSNCLLGLKDDYSTLAWWNKQDPAAREEAFSGTESILTALGKFSDFLRSLDAPNDKIFIWGNGADFDLPILSAAYNHASMKLPWAPFNGRCYRTLKNLYKDVKIKRSGMKHNALDDAKNQAVHAHEILQIHFSSKQD